MRNRLVRIYKGTGVRERQLGDGHFDVLDSDGYAILDEDWEDTIEPGMSLKVRFWTINPPFGVGSDMEMITVPSFGVHTKVAMVIADLTTQDIQWRRRRMRSKFDSYLAMRTHEARREQIHAQWR